MKQCESQSVSVPHQELSSYTASQPLHNRLLIWCLVLVIATLLLTAYFFLKPVVVLSQNVSYSPQISVSLNEPDKLTATASQKTSGKTLRFAVAPVMSPEKSLKLYEDLVEYLATRIGRSPISFYCSSYAETNDLVRHQRCDLAFVCTYAFVRGEREFGMELLAAPEIDSVARYFSYIIVPESSDAQNLLDLRGKEFASADLMSNSGWLFPAMLLTEQREEVASFFTNHLITGSHDRSVIAVAENIVDGAAVHSIVYDKMVTDYPQLEKQIRILLKSPPFGMPPLVVHPSTNPQLQEDLQRLLLTMHEDVEGQMVLERLEFDRFLRPNSEDYNGVRAAARIVESRE